MPLLVKTSQHLCLNTSRPNDLDDFHRQLYTYFACQVEDAVEVNM